MNKEISATFLKLVSFAVVILMLSIGIAGCAGGSAAAGGKATSSPQSSSSASTANGLIQTSSGGGVDIEAEWRGQTGGSLVFDVAMDTHSGSLDYNLKDLSVLRDSNGKEYSPGVWDAPSGGHHVKGILTFPVTGTFNPGTLKYVELIIRGVAGVEERSLRWQLN